MRAEEKPWIVVTTGVPTSREEASGLSERLGGVEDRLARIETLLTRIAGDAAPAAPPRPRPTRTKQPKAKG